MCSKLPVSFLTAIPTSSGVLNNLKSSSLKQYSLPVLNPLDSVFGTTYDQSLRLINIDKSIRICKTSRVLLISIPP